MTHAAIAQHVRGLEDHFSTRLLERAGRGMAPTEAGEALAEGLNEGFGQIVMTARDLLDGQQDRPLRVSLTPTFASNWLMPRLKQFWQAHPEIRVELLPTTKVIDMRKEGVDLAIRFGTGGWPGVEAEHFMQANWSVVGSPDLLKGRKVEALKDACDLTFLMELGNQEEVRWLERHGVAPSEVRMEPFHTVDLALDAAFNGVGVTMLSTPVAQHAVAAGRLEALFEETDSPQAYHLVTRPGTVSEQRKTFIRWLRRQVAAET